MNPIPDHPNDPLVDRERNRLTLLLGSPDKYTVAYLGGGDFLVHAAGIDPDIDRCVHQFVDQTDEVGGRP